MSNKKLYLSDTDQKICGVCGGIAEYFNLDSSIVRIVWIIAGFMVGLGIFFYMICAMIIPRKPKSIDILK